MSAAHALVLPALPDEERHAPIGVPVDAKGRIYLRRRRARVGTADVAVLAQFGGVCWVGRTADAPKLSGVVHRSDGRFDARGRLLLDRLTRIHLRVPTGSGFDVALLNGPGGVGVLLVPIAGFSARLEGVGDATV